MVKKKHRPPSRIKYEENNPTVSIRVDREVKQQLDEFREKSGKSLGDILRGALQVQAPTTKEAFTHGIEEGPIYVTQHGKPKAVLARYDEYEALLKKVEDLEDILLVKESLGAPEEEAIGLEDYERQRAGHV